MKKGIVGGRGDGGHETVAGPEVVAVAAAAALVLVLANHIGDLDVLNEAIALAKRRMLDASQQQQQQQQ